MIKQTECKLLKWAIKGLGAYRLAEAHLVGKDTIDAVFVKADKPRHAFQLIVAEVRPNEW